MTSSGWTRLRRCEYRQTTVQESWGATVPPRHRRALEHSTPEDLFQALLRHQGIPYATMLWGADFFLHKLQGYDAGLTSSEDWDIALRSAKELTAMQATHATAHRGHGGEAKT